MHKESERITLAAELYIALFALISCAAVYTVLYAFEINTKFKWIAACIHTLAVAMFAFIYAPLFGKSVSHSIKGGILNVHYGVIIKYTANVDFKRVVYITKLRGPFERITGVVVLAFYFSGGCVLLPVGDRHTAQAYIRKWSEHIL